MMLQIGDVIDGKYKVLSQIGQGGMSVVYLALNESANKTWAIKEIRKDGVQNFTTVRQGLITEINILKNLNHRYLPSIVDVIDKEDMLLIVMDYIQGKPLDIVLKENFEKKGLPMTVEDVLVWGRQLCEVLWYLHTRPHPIIYRDMKPNNVMLKPNGEICVVDFGTARTLKNDNTEDTTCLGTPGYAAPEQYGGSGQSCQQTDIYNLGVTLHHLITGCNPAATPFHFPLITQSRSTLLEETPKPLRDKVLGLEMIIQKCTQYHVEDRYSSCRELQYDLEHPEALGAPYRKKLKNKLRLFGACAGLAFILGGLSLTGFAMETHTKKNGYDYYISEALTASSYEKLENYRKAIALNPTRKEGYLGVLTEMLSDNYFSPEEDMILTTILNSKENGRDKDNKSYFQSNKSGFTEFSYQLGLAYYYAMGKNGEKALAQGWFKYVADADMDVLNFGENNCYKKGWQARAKILGRISSYYKSKLGVINKAGDAEVSYGDYWDDLMALFDDDVAGDDNVITELRLYNEIVCQLQTNAYKFKNEAGISRITMEKTLDAVEDKIKGLNINENQLAHDISVSIAANIDMARRTIEATFSSASYRADKKTDGGNA